MSLTRRTFLQGLAATAAAIVLPPSIHDNAEAARRFWALDSTMLHRGEWWESDRFDTSHLSDPSIGVPAGQAGGRPLSPYDTIEVEDASWIYPGMELRIYDMADNGLMLPTFEQVRVLSVGPSDTLTMERS